MPCACLLKDRGLFLPACNVWFYNKRYGSLMIMRGYFLVYALIIFPVFSIHDMHIKRSVLKSATINIFYYLLPYSVSIGN